MNPLEHFLERFKQILSIQPSKKAIVACVAAITGVDISEDSIEVKDAVVYIKSHPLVRNEIFMRKALVLEAFKQDIQLKSLQDIR